MTDRSLVFIGALHVDEMFWPTEHLVLRASNPVERQRRVGGVAANAARAAARLQQNVRKERDSTAERRGIDSNTASSSVTLCAATGDDADAQWLVSTLEQAGVRTEATRMPQSSSGHYTVVHDEHGELVVGLSDTGVAERLSVAALAPRLTNINANAIVIDANLSAACLNELLTATLPCESATRARRIALAVSPAKVMRLQGKLEHVDLLICNRREASALSGLSADRALSDLADALCNAGLTRLVLSDGGDPVIVQTETARQHIDVDPIDVNEITSVNGAGDAMAGATIADWVMSDDLASAVENAGLPAAHAIMRR